MAKLSEDRVIALAEQQRNYWNDREGLPRVRIRPIPGTEPRVYDIDMVDEDTANDQM